MGKIEDFIFEARSKPKHVRMRYVWISVAVSMLFVFLLWLLSVRVLLNNDSSPRGKNPSLPELPPLDSPLEKIQSASPSINDIAQPSAQSEGFSSSAAQKSVR
ncbi:MAG TPA: hypothetical protein PKA31_01685 [Candidatus Moranbacteria bacterium]|nr:hypothetical protein [Candidatus Moranbacteria bacterium]